MSFERPGARSAADRVAIEVERLIADLGPTGQRIGTKATLAERYSVAPATLAEALRLLRERGLVDVRPGPHGGVFAIPRSPMYDMARSIVDLSTLPATIGQAVQVLDALDDAVCRDAALFRTAADLKELDDLLSDLERNWDRSPSTMQRNWALHRRIAEITPNAVLRTFYLHLVDYIRAEGFAVSPEAPLGSTTFDPFAAERLLVHRELVAAIRSGSPPRTAAVVAQHGRPTATDE